MLMWTCRPIRPGGVYPAKENCSRCGLCDTYYVAKVKDACAFLGKGMKVGADKAEAKGRFCWKYCCLGNAE